MVPVRSGPTETPARRATCSYRTHDTFPQGSLSRGRRNRSDQTIFYRMSVVRRIPIALAALVFAAPAGATAVVQHDGAEKRLVQRINHVRGNHGLKPLHVIG